MFEHTTIYIALTKRQHLPFSSFWIWLPLVFQLITWREGKGNSKGFFLNSVWKGHKYIQNSVSKGHKYILEKEWEGALFCFITSLASPLHFVSSLLCPPTKIEMFWIKKMRNRTGQTYYDSCSESRISSFLRQPSLIAQGCFMHPPKIEILSKKKMGNRREETFYDSCSESRISSFLRQPSLIAQGYFMHQPPLILVLYAYYRY